MANELIANMGFRKETGDFNAHDFAEEIEKAYKDKNRTSKYALKNFSPSKIGYGHGRCPRYWHLGFNEANFIEDNSPLSIAVMKNGIAVHDRVRDFVEATGRLKDEERLVTNEDPPIKGYVDLVLDWNGKEIPGEAKSTRTEAFINRQSAMKPTGYHLIQILLYMYIMKVDEGFMLYENKNDQRLLLIPVNMTENNKKLLNTVLDWMRNVYKLSKDKESLPARPFRKNSKECKGCPLFDDCYALPKEGVEVDPLPKL